MLPAISAQPGWFETRDFEVQDRAGASVDPSMVDWSSVTRRNFDYVFVQRPGPNNALGQVKFIFPNEHAVYLHDTPARELFGSAERAFSHGCIRVENPIDLAEILLGPNGWDRKRIDAAVASGKTTTVFLTKPQPVLLLYWTANVDPDGIVHFFRDVYQRDPPIARALDGPFHIE
jgi:murein L,D-transpeptidase YcbB/YkuD